MNILKNKGYKNFNFEGANNDLSFSFDELIEYFLSLVSKERPTQELFSYIAETLCKVPIDKLEGLLFNDRFKPIVIMLINEYKYLPDRDVPIIVDVAIRHKETMPELSEKILYSCFKINNSCSHPYHLLCLGSCNIKAITDVDVSKLEAIILSLFSTLTFNQLNRLFDHNNRNSTQILINNFDLLLEKSNLAGLLRLYTLSHAIYPSQTNIIYNKIIERSCDSSLSAKDNNLYLLLKNNVLYRQNTSTNLNRLKGLQQSKKIKLAICISGQMRGYKEAFQSWNIALGLDQVEYKVFVSTWATIGGKKLTPGHSYRYFPDVISDKLIVIWKIHGENKFRDLFTHLVALVDVSTDKITTDDLNGVYGSSRIKIDTDTFLEGNVSNNEKMCYKIEDAYDMALESSEDFDLYMRIRPDKLLEKFENGFDWNELYNKCKSNIVFSDFAPVIRTHHMISVGDQILLANQSNADVAFRPYSIKKYIDDMGGCSVFMRGFVAHNSTSAPCIASNIQFEKLPGVVLTNRNLLNASRKINNNDIIEALVRDYERTNSTQVKSILDDFRKSIEEGE